MTHDGNLSDTRVGIPDSFVERLRGALQVFHLDALPLTRASDYSIKVGSISIDYCDRGWDESPMFTLYVDDDAVGGYQWLADVRVSLPDVAILTAVNYYSRGVDNPTDSGKVLTEEQ